MDKAKVSKKYSLLAMLVYYHVFTLAILLTVNILAPMTVKNINLIAGILIGTVPYLLVGHFLYHNVSQNSKYLPVTLILSIILILLTFISFNRTISLGYCPYGDTLVSSVSEESKCPAYQYFYIAASGYCMGLLYFLIRLSLRLSAFASRFVSRTG